MATERLDIIVAERGARAVRRNIQEVGRAAGSALSPVEQLNRALGVLGGAIVVGELIGTIDTFNRLQNRLRTVTQTTRELNTVTEELFNIARQTRNSFEGTVEIYTRTRLAVRELGISQQETLNFTKSLNQAVILSGAGVREASNALIQLSQGLASNTLRGDELRAVLEQLPVVSDVIAKGLGVTRGELRRLGAQGKISALSILEAFREARQELEDRFAKIVPTIAQSVEVLRTSFTGLLGEIDKATGVSETLSGSILFLADNLETLTSVLGVAAVAFATISVAPLVRNLIAAARAEIEFSRAVSSGNAVALESAKADQLRAAAQLELITVQRAATAARVADVEAAVAQAAAQRALAAEQLRQQRNLVDQIRLNRGVFVGLGSNTQATRNLINAQRALVAQERLLLGTEAELSRARTALAGQTNALAAAEARSAAATAAASTRTARLSQRLPILSAILGTLVGSFRQLFDLIRSNPITSLATTILAAGSALIFFSDDIKVTSDGVVTLADVFKATFTFIKDGIGEAATAINTEFAGAINFLREVWLGFGRVVTFVFTSMLEAAKANVNFLIALFVGAKDTIIRTWNQLPAAFYDIGVLAINGLVSVIEAGINSILDALQFLFSAIDRAAESVGLDKIFGEVFSDVELDKLKGQTTGAFKNVAEIAKEEFRTAFATDFLGNFGDALGNVFDRIIERARAFAKLRADLTKRKGEAGSDSAFIEALERLQKENFLLKQNAQERAVLREILNFERKLRRDLTETEERQVRALVEENLQLELQNEIYSDLRGPQEEFQQRQMALNELFRKGKIDLLELNFELAKLRTEAGQGSFADGFISQLDRMLDRTRSFRSQAGEIFGNFFESISKGFADSIGKAIVFSENLGQAFRRVAQDALATLISALVELGIQFLINQALATSLGSAATATSVAQAAALSSAWAVPAALASLATLGTNSVPASAAVTSTIALTKGLAAIGAVFQSGGLVGGRGGPRDDANLAALSRGEFVVNAEATRKNLATLAAINSGSEVPSGGGSNFNITMNFSGEAANDPDRVGITVERTIRRLIRDETLRQKRPGGVLRQGVS